MNLTAIAAFQRSRYIAMDSSYGRRESIDGIIGRTGAVVGA